MRCLLPSPRRLITGRVWVRRNRDLPGPESGGKGSVQRARPLPRAEETTSAVPRLEGCGRRDAGRNLQHQECGGDVCGVLFHFDHGEFVGARDSALDGVSVCVEVGRRPSGVEAALHVGQQRLP